MPGSPGRAVRPLAGKAALLALAGLPVGGAAKRAAGAVGRVSGWAPGGAPGSLWWGLSAACSCWAPVLRAGDTCIQELILPPSGHGPEAQPRWGHREGLGVSEWPALGAAPSPVMMVTQGPPAWPACHSLWLRPGVCRVPFHRWGLGSARRAGGGGLATRLSDPPAGEAGAPGWLGVAEAGL